MPLLLTEDDVRSVLTMPDVIEAMRPALVQYSTGRAQQPLRTVLELGESKSFFGSMPASLRDPPAVGTKLVTVFASNHGRGLPSHLATIILLDPDTGALMAILDGRYITEARTAAVSAVSTDVLARRDAGVLAMLGSGVQARSHLEALRCVRTLREVRVWSRTETHATAFAREMEPIAGVGIVTAASPALAVRGADLIVTATAAGTSAALIDAADVEDGAHVCAVGACRPAHRELGAGLVARSRVFVDSRIGALAEAGDIVLALKDGVIGPGHIAGELGELLGGQMTGREADGQVTLFKSLGMAVEDVAAAHLAFTRARAGGRGQEVAL
jgi:ornithine cyclodeaminase